MSRQLVDAASMHDDTCILYTPESGSSRRKSNSPPVDNKEYALYGDTEIACSSRRESNSAPVDNKDYAVYGDNNGPVYDQVPTKNKHSAQRVYNFIRSQWLYGVCVILMIALIAVSTLLALELTDDFFNSRTTTYPTTTNTTTNATTTATAPVG